MGPTGSVSPVKGSSLCSVEGPFGAVIDVPYHVEPMVSRPVNVTPAAFGISPERAAPVSGSNSNPLKSPSPHWAKARRVRLLTSISVTALLMPAAQTVGSVATSVPSPVATSMRMRNPLGPAP